MTENNTVHTQLLRLLPTILVESEGGVMEDAYYHSGI